MSLATLACICTYACADTNQAIRGGQKKEKKGTQNKHKTIIQQQHTIKGAPERNRFVSEYLLMSSNGDGLSPTQKQLAKLIEACRSTAANLNAVGSALIEATQGAVGNPDTATKQEVRNLAQTVGSQRDRLQAESKKLLELREKLSKCAKSLQAQSREKQCTQCKAMKPKAEFSNNQWKKKKGVVDRSCRQCSGGEKIGKTSPAPSPDSEVFLSLDVECVATGKTHLHKHRSPAAADLVDHDLNAIGSWKIKPEEQVVSYLTPLTGETEQSLRHGVPLKEAITDLQSLLVELGGGDRVVLVGQVPTGDIQWMNLQRGVHYKRSVDLSDIFQHGGRKFSLRHVAKVVLKKKSGNQPHSSLDDARTSMELFNVSKNQTQAQLRSLTQKIASATQELNVVRRLGYTHQDWNGVCMSGYNSKNCVCGHPLLSAASKPATHGKRAPQSSRRRGGGRGKQ